MRTAAKKQELTDCTGVIESDQRGKHKNRPFKVPDNLKNDARAHISSFPTMESHYCREHSQKKYLEEGLSIARMYRMYQMQLKDKGETNCVSRQMYTNIFNTEFNYSFFKPKKDRYGIFQVLVDYSIMRI